VRKCAANFKKTHQDTWHEDAKRFSDDQLAALSTLLTGSSYCECMFSPCDIVGWMLNDFQMPEGNTV
jgi:proteasome activator subunit 4